MSKKTVNKHYGKIVNGRRQYYNFDLHAETLHDLEGQEFVEVLRLKPKKVSHDAHGYYRAGILGTAMEYEMFKGWEREEIHDDHFSELFLTYKKTVKYMAGDQTMYREKTVKRSTAELTSSEMFEFCEKCIQWLAERGIVVHTPEEYLLGKYKTEVKRI